MCAIVDSFLLACLSVCSFAVRIGGMEELRRRFEVER